MFLVRRCRIHKTFVAVNILVIVVLYIAHCCVLPKLNGAYNNECFLTKKDLSNLRYAVKTIGQTMTKYNVTYWLDFGTLLGAVKRQDVLPWDGDADISFLFSDDNASLHMELYEKYDIASNSLRAMYKGLQIDYVRWKTSKGNWNGKETILLYKYYSERVLSREHFIVLHHHKLQTFPFSWVQQRKTILFNGAKLFVPRDPDKFLRHRYFFTYSLGLSFPYKWKCWVPCWLRTTMDC